MDHELALRQLELLAQVPGALRIITNEIAPDLREDPDDPKSPIRDDVLAADPDILKKVKSVVVHEVGAYTRADGTVIGPVVQLPDGTVQVWSPWGDWTLGYPADVLNRLQEWQRG